MVVTFSLCTGYSSHHHPPWRRGTWLTSLNRPTPRSSSEYVLSSSINSFGFSRGILKTFIESALAFSFIRWFHSLNLQDTTRDAELREALLQNHWTSHQVLPLNYDKHTLRVAQRVLRHPTHALSTPLSSFISCFFVCHLLFDCVRWLNCPPWE